MVKNISRRNFVKKSTAAALGTAVMTGKIDKLLAKTSYNADTDISVVTGSDYLNNTIKSIDALGGISKFVPINSRVAVLANVQRWNPGTFTKPEIVRATIQMCKKAGAKEINFLSLLPEANWNGTGLADVVKSENVNLKLFSGREASNFRKVPISNGRVLKEMEVLKEFYNNDIFITLPITKDHAGNKFTGTLKNMMGLNSSTSNRTFHKTNWTTDPDSIEFLDNCIADMNLVLKPDLCIVDATEFITTNGPMGPGELIKPQKIVAGTDRVAIDSYCATLFNNLKGSDIIMIKKGYEYKLGEIDLNKVNIKQIKS
ncbi:DUF362 domain-containing protein [candidate division KSB1 bacterium]